MTYADEHQEHEQHGRSGHTSCITGRAARRPVVGVLLVLVVAHRIDRRFPEPVSA